MRLRTSPQANPVRPPPKPGNGAAPRIGSAVVASQYVLVASHLDAGVAIASYDLAEPVRRPAWLLAGIALALTLIATVAVSL
jgi:hypothetical protein